MSDYQFSNIDDIFAANKKYLRLAKSEAELDDSQLADTLPGKPTIVAVIRHALLISDYSTTELAEILNLEAEQINKLITAKGISGISVPEIRLMVFINLSREVKASGQSVKAWWEAASPNQSTPRELLMRIDSEDDITDVEHLFDDYQQQFEPVGSYLYFKQGEWQEVDTLFLAKEEN